MPTGRQKRIAAIAYPFLILLPLLILGAAEGVLRLLDIGDPGDAPDPFIGLLESHRIFQVDPARGVYTIDRNRSRSFNVQSFPVRKAAGTFRIFCLGGSAAYGYPFGAPVAYPRWLGDACRHLWPERRFEVINAAGMSYGSYRIRALMTEILTYAPDLIVIYSGHNEFIEKDFYIRSKASRMVGLRGFLYRFHLYHLMKRLILGDDQRPNPADGDFDEFGLHAQRRENVGWTDEEREIVHAKYRENMTAIVERLGEEKIPLLLMVPAPNLADWRPEHSTLTAGLDETSVAAWSAAYAAGVQWQEAGEDSAALAEFERAASIDAHYAELHYRMGQSREALEQYDDARASYVAAIDHDDVPIRIGSVQRAALHDADAPNFTDCWRALEAIAPHGIIGSELFWDYCHPNVRGHQQVAAVACSAIVAGAILPAPAMDGPWRGSAPVSRWDLSALGFAPPDSLDLTELPRGADGIWWLGNCAERQGDRTAAIAWYERSLEANPNHPGSLIGLAVARSLNGQHDEAIELTQRALTVYERANMVQMVLRARAELGVFYARAGRMEEAARTFREVLRRNPTHPKAHANLARALIAMDDLDEAARVLEEGIRLTPSERGLRRELGRVRSLQGATDAAIAAYEEELRLTPGDASLHFTLGQLCRDAGRNEAAASHWETCLRLVPSAEMADTLGALYEAMNRPEDVARVRAMVP